LYDPNHLAIAIEAPEGTTPITSEDVQEMWRQVQQTHLDTEQFFPDLTFAGSDQIPPPGRVEQMKNEVPGNDKSVAICSTHKVIGCGFSFICYL